MRVYTVETKPLPGSRWKLRRYLFTRLVDARVELRTCLGPLGFTNARIRAWTTIERAKKPRRKA